MAKSEIHNSYLDMVDHPAHVKKLTVKQLEQLAKNCAWNSLRDSLKTAAISARISAWWN